jgi:hypothetical protein
MAGIQRKYCPDAVPGSGVASLDVELMIKPYNQGADAGERLSFGLYGKVHRGKAVAANRTREIRPSGMRGGLAETWAMVELGTRCTYRKGACRKLSTCRPRAPQFYHKPMLPQFLFH